MRRKFGGEEEVGRKQALNTEDVVVSMGTLHLRTSRDGDQMEDQGWNRAAKTLRGAGC